MVKNMPRSKVNEGFVYVKNYSYKFRKLIQSLAEQAEKSFWVTNLD